METFSIGSCQPNTAFRADLEQEMELLRDRGLSISLDEENQGLYSFVGCRLEREQPASMESETRVVRYYVANVITDLILNTVTREMLGRMIAGNYSYFNPDERAMLLTEAMGILNAQVGGDHIPRRILRRNQILAKVLNYLEHQRTLVLEGFLRFQLKDYFAEIREAIDRSVDRLMLDREYAEFIKLLRHFVAIQPPRIQEVNVRVKGGGMFSLLDEDGEPIEHEQLRSVLTDLGPDEIDYEDLLLSALITISPARLVLHIIEPLEVVETIRQVFGERVVICEGCGVCRPALVPSD